MDVDELKQRTRAVWSRGDYGGIATLLEPAARALVDACAISAGQEVLDVAAGTGNVALAAAREGAAVVASDITPELIEMGRARAEADGYEIEWVEADVEDLPFEDDRFDCVASAFGAIFAPRPEVVARELFRVVRPGNTVGLTAWTPESPTTPFFETVSRHLPHPEGVPDAYDWGREDVVRERLEGLAATIDFERRSLRWEFESAEAAVSHFEIHGGPHVAAREALGDRYPEVRAELLEALGDSSPVVMEPEYLIVVARRRG